jgi:hypothetical protein
VINVISSRSENPALLKAEIVVNIAKKYLLI